jgi:ADP-heptose:LPS heptosyltransferase
MLAGMLLAAERVLRGRGVEPARVRRVLVLEYRLPLGCVVHMTPVFEAIKQASAGSGERAGRQIEIAVATRGLGLEVLRHSRFVDHLIETPDPTLHLAPAVRALRQQLRVRRFAPHCVLTGASDQRTRIALTSLLGAPAWRGGFTLQPRLYQRPLAYDAGLSLIGNNLRLAGMIGCQAHVTRPRVFFSETDASQARQLLRQANPEGRPVAVFVTQNSGGQNTGWHVDRFVAVVRHAAKRGLAVVYVGTARDAAAVDAIRTAAGGLGVSVAGRTTVSELSALLAMSDWMVTLDTGTMHVGRAAGVPMVVLGPSWQRPLEWMPLGVENVRILRGEDRAAAPPGYRLDEIEAGTVMAALDEWMRLYPDSAEARSVRVSEGISGVDRLA